MLKPAERDIRPYLRTAVGSLAGRTKAETENTDTPPAAESKWPALAIPKYHFSVNDPVRNESPLAHTPTVPLRLASDMAWELGFAPKARITVDPRYRPHIANAAGSNIFEELIAQTQSSAEPASDTPRFEALVGNQDTCALAERRILHALRHPETPAPAAQAVRIITNAEGDPLLFQKNVNREAIGVNIGLSLRPLTIGRVVWPAGTLMKVHSSHQVKDGAPVTAIDQDRVISLGVVRLSAFALPPAERTDFVDLTGQSQAEGRVIGGISMAEIRDHVQDLLTA